ncbi:g299 [Yersinia phage phiR1-37]|uniref:tail fiber assembly protein n=1 Tax=Yersinia phage phiR1-37 TaxID=331278 RepID=UPI00022DBDD6|nr:tail fiber assembly protein [Yersinia phage phiR1-37]CCE26322.1 g299 [Yersinia phage phiR1-37]
MNTEVNLNYMYSPSLDVCYPYILYQSYKDSGTWPTDGIEITPEVYEAYFLTNAPEGKKRTYDASKKTFSWKDIPPYQYSTVEKQDIGRGIRNTFIRATDVMMLSDYTINDTLLTDKQKEEVTSTRIAFKTWPTLDNWWDMPLPSVPQWIIDDAHDNRGYIHPSANQWPLPPFA